METARRKGYTLGELLIVVALTSTTLGMCLGTIHTAIRQQRRGDDEHVAHRIAERVSQLFREDMHGASTVELNEVDGVMELRATGDGDTTSTVYRVDHGRISRIAVRGKGAEHREVFELPPDVHASLRYDGSKDVGLMMFQRLPDVHPDDGEQHRRWLLHVQPTVGRNARFSTLETRR